MIFFCSESLYKSLCHFWILLLSFSEKIFRSGSALPKIINTTIQTKLDTLPDHNISIDESSLASALCRLLLDIEQSLIGPITTNEHTIDTFYTTRVWLRSFNVHEKTRYLQRPFKPQVPSTINSLTFSSVHFYSTYY